jgi:hypothetical protein
MSDDNATLRDTVVDAGTPAAETKPEVKVEAKPEAALDFAEQDALEVGRILLESGVTKDRVNDLLSAPGALNSLRHMVVNNQREFLNMLERTDPDAATKFLDSMADIYLERNKSNIPAGDGKEAPANAGLMAQIAALSEKTNQMLSREQQREQSAMVAQVKARYNGRVDDMLGQEGIKALSLTKSETKALRASLDQALGSDPSVVARINAGNFVDVPREFKSIVEEWTNDRKAAAEELKAARERSEKGASFGYPLGADAGMVDIPADAADSWEATEAALAAQISKQMKSRR